jgi:hypothetical protein
MANIPNTAAQVHYSYELRTNGLRIGMVETFTPDQTRTLERLREIANNGGVIVEIVPGVSEYTLTLEHVHLYKKSLIKALGYDIVNIQDIKDPIDIVEIANNPDGTKDKTVYGKCWIQRSGKTVATTKTYVTDSITLWPTEVRKGS